MSGAAAACSSAAGRVPSQPVTPRRLSVGPWPVEIYSSEVAATFRVLPPAAAIFELQIDVRGVRIAGTLPHLHAGAFDDFVELLELAAETLASIQAQGEQR